MSILLCSNEVAYAGRLHRAWWAECIENPCTLSLILCKRLTRTDTHTHTRARFSLGGVHARCYVCQTQKEYACVLVHNSLLFIFFEKVSCIRKNFFLKMVVFLMWPNKWFEHRLIVLPMRRIPFFHWISNRNVNFPSMNFANGRRKFCERKCNATQKPFRLFLSCQIVWQT